jgi:hypothetical protein
LLEQCKNNHKFNFFQNYSVYGVFEKFYQLKEISLLNLRRFYRERNEKKSIATISILMNKTNFE